MGAQEILRAAGPEGVSRRLAVHLLSGKISFRQVRQHYGHLMAEVGAESRAMSSMWTDPRLKAARADVLHQIELVVLAYLDSEGQRASGENRHRQLRDDLCDAIDDLIVAARLSALGT